MVPPFVQRRSLPLMLAVLAAVYVGWYALYELWLLPDGRLPAAVALNAAHLAGGLLDALGLDPAVEGRVVRLPGGGGVLVDDACAGLAVVGLFAGFVIAFPGRWARRAWFLVVGAVAIHLSNVVRIAALAWLHDLRPDLFGPVHQLGGPAFFYAVVFVLWMVWARIGEPAAEPAADGPAECLAEPVVS